MNTPRTKWHRVSRDRLCPVCGKPDWCLVSADGAVAICPRTESSRRCGDAGWLHILLNYPFPRLPRRVVFSPTPSPPDMTPHATALHRKAGPERLRTLAATLNLSTESLATFRVGYDADRGAWSFPMTDPRTALVTNIRFRAPSGSKFGMAGGRDSLFLPVPAVHDEVLMVCEGETDAVAAHGIGFRNAVGRPSCTGGTAHLVTLVRSSRPPRVVVVGDNDGPGVRGAVALASTLALHCHDVRFVLPPHGVKDVRDWVEAGASRSDFDARIEAVRPIGLKLVVTTKGGQ